MKILSIIYGIIVKIRNLMYDLNVKKCKKIDDVEIICVGNIIVGGSGKTPTVQYYANKYLKDGKKVGILSRGYKGKRKKDPYVVRDFNNIYGSSRESGDEAYLHALSLDIPVVVSKNRYLGAKYIKEKFDVDVIIMDDGYQHRKLYRNKNIVLVDATNPFGNFYYLPYGKLRESLYELKRANEIIISKCNYVNKLKLYEIVTVLKKYNVKNVPIKYGIYEKEYFYNKNGDIISLDEIKDKNVFIFSSIANPKVFYDTIKELKPKEIKQMSFEDHHLYVENEIEEILENSKKFDYIITTEKDIVKINDENNKILVLKMKVNISERL